VWRNYASQLRAYSVADLVLLILAAGGDAPDVLVVVLLWLGFLVYLEWRHRDRGRARWPSAAWIAPWVCAVALRPTWILILFFAFALLYAEKKAVPLLAATAPLSNGALKATLVALIPGVSATWVLAALVLTGIRNLAGDVRDADKDRDEHVQTIPVRLGLHSHPLAYPSMLALTSTVWVVAGRLPWWSLVLAWIIQRGTYNLTPR
jgi:hypothetical protein